MKGEVRYGNPDVADYTSEPLDTLVFNNAQPVVLKETGKKASRQAVPLNVRISNLRLSPTIHRYATKSEISLYHACMVDGSVEGGEFRGVIKPNPFCSAMSEKFLSDFLQFHFFLKLGGEVFHGLSREYDKGKGILTATMYKPKGLERLNSADELTPDFFAEIPFFRGIRRAYFERQGPK
jgi:hypothetical protein